MAPHLYFAATRALVAGSALLILAFMLGRPAPRGKDVWLYILIVGFGATTLGFLGMVHAAEFIAPGIATVIANTQPLMAAVLAYPILSERLSGRGKLGLIMGFGGIVLVTLPQLQLTEANGYLSGVAYILLAAFGITISNVIIKRLAGKVDALMAMGWQLILGAVPLWIATWIYEEPASTVWSGQFLLILLFLSLLGTALVYYLWFSVLEKVQLNHANAFSFLIPIFGLTMGFLFYSERFGWLEIAGIGLTLAGIVQVNRTESPSLNKTVQ